MGRKNPGKADRDLLFQSLSRLRAHTLRVTINGRYDYVGGLLMQLSRDQITGRYQVQLDPQLHKLFSHGWTRLDHTVRAALAGKPLAQWLTAFYATHAKPYPMKVTTLHELSGSHTDDLKRFRQSLCEALDQITVLDAAGRGVRPTPGLKGRKRRRAASIDFFAYWRIDGDDLVHVIRNPRYLHEKQLQIARGETSNEAETAELDEVATHEDNEAGDDFFD
jgi:hypothetical protein